MISVIVTAFDNTKFIEDSIISIIESCGTLEYEILVGVDNCNKTLDTLIQLYPKFNSRVKILFFTQKTGTYIIRNTLVKECKFDKLLFFDSDDIMREDLVPSVLESLKRNDYVRYGHITFSNVLTLPKKGKLSLPPNGYPVGTFGINKNIFLNLNGFEPWMVAADGEFFWRVQANNLKIDVLSIIGLFYRRYENNLTSNEMTGMNSSLRKHYHEIKKQKQIKNLKQPLPSLTTADFVQIINTNPTNGNISKPELSIIIPTFGEPSFLEECINSIISSIKTLWIEILVGVDGCEKTLNYIRNKTFDFRVRFFYFQNNSGPYVVKNSLSKISKSDYILFFDSDDVMGDNMVERIFFWNKHNTIVKPMYKEFNDGEKTNWNEGVNGKFGEGVFMIKKELFVQMNGFEGWRCAADSDFMNRIYKSNLLVSVTDSPVFKRRLHKNSLTQNPNTDYASPMRAKYYGLSKMKKDFGPLPIMVTENFYEIETKPLNVQELTQLELQKNLSMSIISQVLEKNKVSSNIDYSTINERIKKQGVYDVNSSNRPVRENKPKNREQLIEIKKNSNASQARQLSPGKPNRRRDLPNIFGKRNS